MEDRYLYKAKTAKIVSAYNNAEDGVWVKGYLRCDTGKWTIYQFEFDRADYVFYEIDPDTICQCTGLKDKKGKLIWENDIVVCRDFTEEKYVIAWKQYEACFEYQQYGCSIMNFEQLSGCEVEVVGNIFDNPELESEG